MIDQHSSFAELQSALLRHDCAREHDTNWDEHNEAASAHIHMQRWRRLFGPELCRTFGIDIVYYMHGGLIDTLA